MSCTATGVYGKRTYSLQRRKFSYGTKPSTLADEASQEYVLSSQDLLHCSIGVDLAFLHLLVELVQHLVLLQSRHEHGHKTLLQQRQQFLLTALAAAHEELPGGRQGLSMLLNSSIEFGDPHVFMGLGSQDRGFHHS